jgi:hypothetical protein
VAFTRGRAASLRANGDVKSLVFGRFGSNLSVFLDPVRSFSDERI